MQSKKITESEIVPLTVSSLPTRPTAPAALGGRGYTPEMMKAAFDALPRLLTERLNLLIDDITAPHGQSITGAMETGIREGHVLMDLFDDLTSGEAASYITVFETTLIEFLAALRRDVDALMEVAGDK